MVLWLTGPSGAGKTAIASVLKNYFEEKWHAVAVLDGDDIRDKTQNFSFTPEARETHQKYVAWCASELEKLSIVIVATISPKQKHRDYARSLCTEFKEIWVATETATLKRRDPKGLYAAKTQGLLDYEVPKNPDLIISGEDPLNIDYIQAEIWTHTKIL